MGVQAAAAKQLSLLGTLGKSGLNLLYPNEFELYVCALELTDYEGNTLKYFVFPVMPNGIDESKPQPENIKKTLAGVTSLSTPTFNPTSISLNGTFGRSFKVVLGTDATDFLSSFTVNGAGKQVNGKSLLSGTKQLFDSRIKTGYGCIKILEEIIEQSRIVDNKGVRRLIFYNLALGNSYLVRVENLRLSMSLESNMIWNYSLQMRSIAPLSSIMTAEQVKQKQFRLVTTGYVQGQTQRVVNGLSNILGKGLDGAVRKKREVGGKLNAAINKQAPSGNKKNKLVRKWI